MEGYASEKPIRERFLHLGAALLRYFIENPLDFRYLEQFHNSPYGVEFRRDKILRKKECCDVYRELFDEGVSQQVIKDLPLVILFALLFGPILAVARDHILGLVSTGRCPDRQDHRGMLGWDQEVRERAVFLLT